MGEVSMLCALPRRSALLLWLLAAPALIAPARILPAAAETLPLPDRLVDARSAEGGALLMDGGPREAYLQIASVYETQANQAYCGVASMVMVLNALRVPAPTSPEYRPFAMFTQGNVLDEATDAILPRAVLARQGTTLDQLGQLLARHPVGVSVHHAAPGGLDAFRAQARAYVEAKDRFVIVNFLRKAIGQETGGHISPLAAYDARTDRFLLLDVARYKYPPVWVTAADLFAAMDTTDAVTGQTRGYVLVGRADAPER